MIPVDALKEIIFAVVPDWKLTVTLPGLIVVAAVAGNVWFEWRAWRRYR